MIACSNGAKSPCNLTRGGSDRWSIERNAIGQLEGDIRGCESRVGGIQFDFQEDNAVLCHWSKGKLCFELNQDRHHGDEENEHGHDVVREIEQVLSKHLPCRNENAANVFPKEADFKQMYFDLVFGACNTLLVARMFVNLQRHDRAQDGPKQNADRRHIDTKRAQQDVEDCGGDGVESVHFKVQPFYFGLASVLLRLRLGLGDVSKAL